MTTPTLYRRRVAGIRDSLPDLHHVLLVGEPAEAIPGTSNLDPLLSAHRECRRAIEPGGRRVGPGGARPADPRQLVADRETGGIMIANLAGADIRPGSMGRPLPGVEAVILRRGADGRAAVRNGAVDVIEAPDVDGELALKPGWPSMFRGYLHDDARTAASFRRVVPDRRRRPARRRRVDVVRRPRRRRDQVGRPRRA